MISTRLVYKKLVFRHSCSSCGHEWEDNKDYTDGCPHCSPPSELEKHKEYRTTLKEVDPMENL